MEAGVARKRSRIRLFLLGLVFLLFVFSVPWYRGDPEGLSLVLGLPNWVAVALGCYGVAAILNSLAWLWTDIDDDAAVEFPLADQGEERES